MDKQETGFSVIHFSTRTSWRGGEQQIKYLVEELAELGIKQALLSPENSVLYKRSSGFIQCHTYKKRFYYVLSTAKRLNSICKKYPSALIHIHDSTAHTIAVFSGFFLRNKTPLIVSRRVDFPINPGFLSTFKYNFPTIKRIICVSYYIQEVIQPRIKDKSVLATVFSGIDLSLFVLRSKTQKLKQEFNLPSDSILIGNTSALADHKDYLTFVDTAAILLELDFKFRFLIIGEGPEFGLINKYIIEKGLEKSIIMTGFRTDVHSILPELDLFLITSKTEGLGTSILDAFASRIPVVATRAGGIPEVITDMETGLLAAVQNPAELANQVIRMMTNHELRTKIIEQAHQLVQSFSKRQTALKTCEIYRNVMNFHDRVQG